MCAQCGGNHRNTPVPIVLISREQFPPTVLRKQGEDHLQGLEDKAAVWKGMLYLHFVEECPMEEPGEINALIWLSLRPQLLTPEAGLKGKGAI